MGDVNQFLVGKNNLIPIVTRIKGEKIKDEDLLKDVNRNLNREKYKKIKERKCS